MRYGEWWVGYDTSSAPRVLCVWIKGKRLDELRKIEEENATRGIWEFHWRLYMLACIYCLMEVQQAKVTPQTLGIRILGRPILRSETFHNIENYIHGISFFSFSFNERHGFPCPRVLTFHLRSPTTTLR